MKATDIQPDTVYLLRSSSRSQSDGMTFAATGPKVEQTTYRPRYGYAPKAKNFVYLQPVFEDLAEELKPYTTLRDDRTHEEVEVGRVSRALGNVHDGSALEELRALVAHERASRERRAQSHEVRQARLVEADQLLTDLGLAGVLGSAQVADSRQLAHVLTAARAAGIVAPAPAVDLAAQLGPALAAMEAEAEAADTREYVAWYAQRCQELDL